MLTENCDNYINSFIKNISNNIKQNLEKKYKKHNITKSIDIVIYYKNIENESKVCKYSFNSNYYPNNIANETIVIIINVNFEDLGLFIVNGINENKLANNIVTNIANNVKLKINLNNSSNLNTRGIIYKKSTILLLLHIVFGYILYKELAHNNKLIEALEKIKNIKNNDASNLQHTFIETKTSLLQGLDNISKNDYLIGLAIGIIVLSVIINKMFKTRKTKKEIQELELLYAHIENYMIVQEIINTKQNIFNNHQTNSFFNELNTKLHELAHNISTFVYTHTNPVNIIEIFVIFTFVITSYAATNLLRKNFKSALTYITFTLGAIIIVGYFYPIVFAHGGTLNSDILSYSDATDKINAFINVFRHEFFYLTGLAALIGTEEFIEKTIIRTIFRRILENTKKAIQFKEITFNDIKQQFASLAT